MKLITKGTVLAALAGGILLAAGGVASADADATGAAIGSPGILSGNVVQIPIDHQVNDCGNSFNLIGLLNPTFGNTCVNVSGQTGGDTGTMGRGQHMNVMPMGELGEHHMHAMTRKDCK